MSNVVFPSLPGFAWNRKRTPMWSTLAQKSISGRESRRANYVYPLYTWTLPIEFMRSLKATELQTLIGFYNARNGMFDSFLYLDPLDNTATAQLIGIGDGVTSAFQLVRTFGGFVEPIAATVAGSVSLTVSGSATTAFTVDNTTGIVTFTTPPALGAAIAATCQFYWRVRFSSDSYDFEEFMNGYWMLDEIGFQTFR